MEPSQNLMSAFIMEFPVASKERSHHLPPAPMLNAYAGALILGSGFTTSLCIISPLLIFALSRPCFWLAVFIAFNIVSIDDTETPYPTIGSVHEASFS